MEGFLVKKLSDIAIINPPKDRGLISSDLEVSFIPMEHIDGETGSISKQDIRKAKEVYKGYTSFSDGDVIFAKITPCMENGKSAIARNLKNGKGFGSTEFYVIRPRANISAEYLWHFLRQEEVRKVAAQHFTGAVGHKRVPKEHMESIELPIWQVPHILDTVVHN